MFTYSLVNTSTIEGLHGSLGSSWIVVFDKTVVETLALDVVSKRADVEASSAFVVDQILENNDRRKRVSSCKQTKGK